MGLANKVLSWIMSFVQCGGIATIMPPCAEKQQKDLQGFYC